jgi:chromosome partitioning protein
MKFTRTKKLVFFNNKGGVGKTTIAYNTAIKFANNGYKTVLIDLDPQCNLSELVLGNIFEKNIFSDSQEDIYKVVSELVSATGDINKNIQFTPTTYNNLFVLPGSLKLSLFEELLVNNFSSAMSGQEAGYTITSAISRFLSEKGLNEEIDIFIIDTSPSLGVLNKVILLDSDYFITPMKPDNFSLMGIENLGLMLEKWKHQWKVGAKALAGEILSSKVLSGEAIFLGYIINDYNQYNKKAIKVHSEWINKISDPVLKYLSKKHSKSDLVDISYKTPISIVKDYGQIASQSQKLNKAIFDITKKDFQQGTKDNIEQSGKEFQTLYDNVVKLIKN